MRASWNNWFATHSDPEKKMNPDQTIATLLKLARQQLDHRERLLALARESCPKFNGLHDAEQEGIDADRALLDSLGQAS
jgi:hypothetical protein